jgi:hypothetical protein
MTTWKTRTLALAAMLLSGCAPTTYAGNQYDNSPYYDQNAGQYDNQYGGQYDQYNDQPNVNVNVGVSFGGFQRQLAPYGNWTYNSRWGDVWRPRAAGFRPYFDGYWANTREYGVVWVSNDPWGDVTTHYGRWVFDPRDGWLWVPGYVWGPSWVVWRSGGGQIGWFPMPPDDYYGNGPYRGRYDNYYGYRDWYGPSFGNDTFFSLWIFVGEDRFSDRNYRNYVRPQREYNTIIVNTTEVTNYVTVNNYIVNRSINIERVERASNRRFEAVEARNVIRRESVATPVTAGRQIEQRERRERPIPANANANAGNGNGNGNNPRANGAQEREDARDTRQDARDARQDNAPNVRARPNEQVERNPRVVQPQNAQGPQGGNNQADRREERIDNRERVQAPQNAVAPQQNGNAERNVVERPVRERPDNNNARQNAPSERAADRAVERGGNNQNAVQPAAAKPDEAASVPARGRTATREEREAERNARREENEQKAAARQRNADR